MSAQTVGVGIPPGRAVSGGEVVSAHECIGIVPLGYVEDAPVRSNNAMDAYELALGLEFSLARAYCDFSTLRQESAQTFVLQIG